jgi:hypothetical protein
MIILAGPFFLYANIHVVAGFPYISYVLPPLKKTQANHNIKPPVTIYA